MLEETISTKEKEVDPNNPNPEFDWESYEAKCPKHARKTNKHIKTPKISAFSNLTSFLTNGLFFVLFILESKSLSIMQLNTAAEEEIIQIPMKE